MEIQYKSVRSYFTEITIKYSAIILDKLFIMADERREYILIAVRSIIDDMIQERAMASVIHSRIHTELENRLNLNDSNEFRATVTTEAVSLVDSMLQASDYYIGNPPVGNPPGSASVHCANLPPGSWLGNLPAENQAANPPGPSVHHAMEAQLPPEEQVQEAAATGLQEALEVETPLIPQHALAVAPTAEVQHAVTVRQEGNIKRIIIK